MKKKKQRTAQLIKTNLLALLDEKTLDKITVHDLCEKSMIQRSTFYNHYQDKYQVLEEINHELVLTVDKHLEKRFSATEIDTILYTIIADINQEQFLKMITIQEGPVNLRKKLKELLKVRFKAFLEQHYLPSLQDVSQPFLEELFSVIALTYIEYSVTNGPSKKNSAFLNELQKKFLSTDPASILK